MFKKMYILYVFYITFLFIIQCEVNAESEPLDDLTPEVISWLASLNCNFTKVSEVVANKPKEVFEAIQKGIDNANKKAVSNAQKIQKFALLPTDFSLPTGELGKSIRIFFISIDCLLIITLWQHKMGF